MPHLKRRADAVALGEWPCGRPAGKLSGGDSDFRVSDKTGSEGPESDKLRGSFYNFGK